jgi:septum formation protein
MSSHPFLRAISRPLVLASQSPRRAEILRMHGLQFTIAPAHLDEDLVHGEAFDHYVTRLARDKALHAAAVHPQALCLGADTIVVQEGEILGKPTDKAQACAILERLQGRRHSVLSAIALACAECDFLSAEAHRTEVRFRKLTRAEIERYVESGEPMDKAGAYGIQGYGAMIVEHLDGEYFNVMGLPVQGLRRLWAEYASRHEA